MLDIFLLLSAIASLIAYLFIQSYCSKFAQLCNLIPGPRRVPIIGFIGYPNNGRDKLKFLKKMTATYGGTYKLWYLNNIDTITTDAMDAEAMLKSQHALDKGRMYDFLQQWLGTGLLTSSGLKWHTRRKALTPAFHFQILEQYVEIFNRKGSKFLEVLEAKANADVFNIQRYISNYTLDVICESAMGVEMNAQENTESQYLSAVKSILLYVLKSKNKNKIMSKLSFNKENSESVSKMLEVLHGFTNKVIRTKRLERNESKAPTRSKSTTSDEIRKKSPFLELLLSLEETPGSSVENSEDIREEVDTFMFEGHDTTASALSAIMFLLGKHQNVQDKVFEEIQHFSSGADSYLTYQDLKNLRYTEMVIKEGMRLYPPVPSISRYLLKDLILPSGFTLPAGSNVGVDIFHIHRNPKYYSNPEEFNPDNFLPENAIKRPSHAFIPFSAGPRNCIGQKFAMLEMKTTLSKCLRKYKIEYGGSEIQPNATLILNSDNGFPVKLSLRN